MSLQLKRSYPVILLLIAVLAVLTFGMGDQKIIAYNTQKDTAANAIQADSRFNITNDTALFDNSVVHSIQVLMADEQYEQMITTYQETGLKEYFQVDVIIDGVQVNDVGIRLKGNASLSTALGRGLNAGGDFRQDLPNQGEGNFPGGDGGWQIPEDSQKPQRPNEGQIPEDGRMPQIPPEGEGFALPENSQGQFGGGQRDFQNANAKGEVKIPFMIKFDEFVEDQTYQGYSAVAIRTYGTSYNEAMLAEPVTNEVARLVGLPATLTAYAGFGFNEDDETLYVISELVNEEYLTKYFSNDNGVLYKAEIGSTLGYQGDNPSDYAESFTQQTRVNDADLAPLIEFIRFLDEADDDTFVEELPDYLDIDSFATYLALNALLVNTDSLIGMNNNYYLYYDDLDGRFTLLMWDTNESLGNMGSNTSFDITLTDIEDTFGMPGRGARGIGGGENTLIERFLAVPAFQALYEEKLQVVYRAAYVNGEISAIAARYAALIDEINPVRPLVDQTAYDQAVQNLLDFISQRNTYLSGLELLTQ